MQAGPATLSDRDRLKAIFAASAGNLVEWYDFYVYAFTALYFSAAFFPKSDPLVQIMATSGIFAAGFFMQFLCAAFSVLTHDALISPFCSGKRRGDAFAINTCQAMWLFRTPRKTP